MIHSLIIQMLLGEERERGLGRGLLKNEKTVQGGGEAMQELRKIPETQI